MHLGFRQKEKKIKIKSIVIDDVLVCYSTCTRTVVLRVQANVTNLAKKALGL